jgi:hypothetical protein
MEKVTVFYDKVGNTLDVWFTRPQKGIVCQELDYGIILKRTRRGRIVGFEKINFLNKAESSRAARKRKAA